MKGNPMQRNFGIGGPMKKVKQVKQKSKAEQEQEEYAKRTSSPRTESEESTPTIVKPTTSSTVNPNPPRRRLPGQE